MLLLAAVLVLVLSLVLLFVGWLGTERLRLQGCVYSVAGDLAEYSRKLGDLGPGDGDWYILTSDERLIVLSDLPDANCARVRTNTADSLKETIEIAVKRDKASKSFEVRAWLRSPDEISGTADDVLAFPDQTPPIKK